MEIRETNLKRRVMKTINLVPRNADVITTANVMPIKTSLILNEKPTFMSIQQVVAVGPRTEDIKIGDWIYLDLQRFVKHVKTQSVIKAGVGGQDMIKEEFIPPIWIAPGDTGAYFKITDREIEGVIIDYKKLPKDMREHMTVESYEQKLNDANKRAEKEKARMDKASFPKKPKDAIAPAIFAEGKFRG